MGLVINSILIIALVFSMIIDAKRIKSNEELIKSDKKIYKAQKELEVKLDERNKILKEIGKDLKKNDKYVVLKINGEEVGRSSSTLINI